MSEFLCPDELFDVQYDVCETLFDRIRDTIDSQKDDLAALKTIRDHVVHAVAAMANVTPESVYREREDVREDSGGP